MQGRHSLLISFCKRTPPEACLEASVEIAKGVERWGRWRTGWEVNAAFKAVKVLLQEQSQDQG